MIPSLFSVKITGRIAKRKRRLNFDIFSGFFFRCFVNKVGLLNAITYISALEGAYPVLTDKTKSILTKKYVTFTRVLRNRIS